MGIQSALRAPSPAVPLDKAWPGWLIAKDIVFVPVGTGAGAGNGILVLDGFGGVHEGGALTLNPITPKTPYFGFDIARAIAYRNVPPRANFAISNTVNTEVTSGSNVVVASTTLTLPDDGFVLILGNLSMGNNSLVSGATAQARICVGVDGTGCLGSIDRAVDMEPAVDATSFHGEAVTQGAFLSSGAHTFNLLVRKFTGTGQVIYFDPTITAVYVDQDEIGTSAAAGDSNAGPTGPPVGR